MIFRYLLVSVFILSLSFAKTNDAAKFLVVEKKVYNKIEALNILNGGIKRDYTVNSIKLSESSLKKYYPEFYLYNASTICYNINKVYINEHNLNTKVKYYKNVNDIKKEIKKIKLLQILSESKYKNTELRNININTIKSVGLLCDGNLFLRGKIYSKNSTLDRYKIKSINMKNASLSLRKR